MVSVPPASIETAGGFLIVAEIPSLHWRQVLFNISPCGIRGVMCRASESHGSFHHRFTTFCGTGCLYQS